MKPYIFHQTAVTVSSLTETAENKVLCYWKQDQIINPKE